MIILEPEVIKKKVKPTLEKKGEFILIFYISSFKDNIKNKNFNNHHITISEAEVKQKAKSAPVKKGMNVKWFCFMSDVLINVLYFHNFRNWSF